MNAEDAEFLESLRKDFVEETFDLLSKCEESLLNYEQGFEESFYLDYMRRLHSIKGSARAVEFDLIASTVHIIESIGQKNKREKFVELSLSSLDSIRNSLEFIKNDQLKEANANLTELTNFLTLTLSKL